MPFIMTKSHHNFWELIAARGRKQRKSFRLLKQEQKILFFDKF